MKKIHLLCNAHLDPVWLWQKSEGMAEAMATFRIAADFCEEYEEFISRMINEKKNKIKRVLDLY